MREWKPLVAADNYRSKLKIPHNSIVLCRHGGMKTFNIPFVTKTVLQLVDLFGPERLHFIFLGTEKFVIKDASNKRRKGERVLTSSSKQIHFLPTSTAEDVKERFFNTCNAMIHARYEKS